MAIGAGHLAGILNRLRHERVNRRGAEVAVFSEIVRDQKISCRKGHGQHNDGQDTQPFDLLRTSVPERLQRCHRHKPFVAIKLSYGAQDDISCFTFGLCFLH
jgi:hypothetical protein